jgi:hypothetical protein
MFGVSNFLYHYLKQELVQMPRGPKTHHVVPSPNGGWAVKRGGSNRASSHHETKQEAINAGRTTSRTQGTELRIHNKDGRIGSSDSHGNDPHPPKG